VFVLSFAGISTPAVHLSPDPAHRANENERA